MFDNLEYIDVVDIEENIFDIAKEYFDFKKSDRTNFYLQDGIVFLRENTKKYDLIVVDVASDDGIDDRFLSDEYFKLIKKSLVPNGLFVSNLCSSADLKHPKNTFFCSVIQTYKSYFQQVDIFKGNESDRVYYKAFFDIDKRVIDITNVILISSNSAFNISDDYRKIESAGIEIKNYINDLQTFL